MTKKRLINFLLCLGMVLLYSNISYSQEKRIFKGKITDENNDPLIGVNVSIQHTTIGTVSDLNGEYKLLDISDETILVFSYIGYKTETITVGKRSTFNLQMLPNEQTLNEIVVTALGVERETKALGYSITEVESESLTEAPSTNAINALSGKVAGVSISTPSPGVGSSSRVVIRGNSSLSTNNQPLYVIDGIPMDNQQLGSASGWGGNDLGDGVSGLNPDDIKSMSVLKGPSAAALYGTRAQHGVILITTKQGSKGIEVEVNSNIIADKIANQFNNIQTVYGQGMNGDLPLTQETAINYNSWGAKLDPNLKVMRFDGEIVDYGIKDNFSSFFRTGYTLTNTVSVKGGADNSTFRISYTNLNNSDVTPNSGMGRNTINLRASNKFTDKFSIDTKVTYQMENVKNRPYHSTDGANIGKVLTTLPASFDQAWLKENTLTEDGRYQRWNSYEPNLNPYYVLNHMSNDSEKDRLIGFIQANYDFNNWLKLRLKSGLDTYNFEFERYAPKTTPNQIEGRMDRIGIQNLESNSEFLLTASKTFNDDFYVSGSVGGNIMYYEQKRTDINGRSEVTEGIQSINNYSEFLVGHSFARKQINSLYAFANFGYKNYLFLDLTARNDWSSTLPPQNNSFFYPSISSSFVFTDAFEMGSEILSFGKFRASFAEVGGDTYPYNLDMQYMGYPYSFQDNSLTKISSNTIPNSNLLPSRTQGYEFGTDLRFFNGLINIDVAYYSQDTKDEIVRLPTPASSGFRYAFANTGHLRNHGFEGLLEINPIKTKNFKWTTTFNITKNYNEVISLGDGIDVQELGAASWMAAFVHARQGQSFGDIMGYDFKRTESGDVLFTSDGLPVIDNTELKVLGNSFHDVFGGLGMDFAYKNVSLRFLFDFKFGGEILSMTNLQMHQNGMHENTLEGREEWANGTGGYVGKGVVNIGTEDNPVYEENTTAIDPQVYWMTVTNNGVSSPFVYDASYIKLRELSINYTLSDRLCEKIGIKGASFGLVSRNTLILWTAMPNIDPEAAFTSGNGQGLEFGSLPTRASFGGNINLKF